MMLITPAQNEARERRHRFHATIAIKAMMVNRPPTAELPVDEPGWLIEICGFDPSADLHRLPTIREIQMAAADHFSVNRFDLISDRKTLDLILPRQIAVYLSCLMTPHRLSEIARAFHRDHTTMLHAYRRILRKIARDPAVAEHVRQIRWGLIDHCTYRHP